MYNIFNFSPYHSQPEHHDFYRSFFSFKDTLTTPSEPDALLTYQNHKGNPSSTQHTCLGHRDNLEWQHGHNSRALWHPATPTTTDKRYRNLEPPQEPTNNGQTTDNNAYISKPPACTHAPNFVNEISSPLTLMIILRFYIVPLTFMSNLKMA